MPLSDQSTPSLTPSPSRSPSPTPPVQPDHFYSPDGDAQPSAPSPDSTGRSWLSPDDDPLATKGIPVFKPTMAEFADFEGYMTRVECWGMRSGIVKIIPPKEWSDALPSVRPQLADVRIKSPIEQHMLGRSGLYRQQNIEKRKAISLREWAEICAKDEFRAPAIDEVGLKAAGEHVTRTLRRSKRGAGAEETEVEVEVEGVVVREEGEDESSLVAEHDHSEVVPDADTPLPTPSVDADADIDEPEDPAPAPRKRRVQTRADREAALSKRAELDKAFLETFDAAGHWLPRNTSAADYTPAFCATLERRYWRNCGLGKPPWYGADTAGSLFTEETTAWNVGGLPSALSRLLPASANGLPGVNTPYLYFGMWRATFAWHVEDMDLFSINYIHFGAPKFWYAIPQARSVQLENTLRSFFPRDVAQCRQFLRHKSFLASPTLLAQSSCKPNKLVQHAGEFVITFPRGYHAGFNLGLNCAESVNFALDSWLDIGRKAQVCGCIGDSVRIDVDTLLREREEEASKPPSKPRSRKLKCDADAKPKSSRKRKSDGAGPSKAKKIKIKAEPPADGEDPSAIRQKITLKVPKDLGPFPCCLCVSRDLVGLLRVHDPPSARANCQNYQPKDMSGHEAWRAHESCAMIVPETWVDEIAVQEQEEIGQAVERMEKVVFGVDAIVKDRWALKCTACQKSRAKSHGAPIQCTKGKCPKAFHVSCARDGGVEARIHFAEVRTVEKEVVLNELPALSGSAVNGLPDSIDAQASSGYSFNMATVDPSLLTTPAPAPSIKIAPPEPFVATSPIQLETAFEPNVIKTIKKIEYELLCTQHNPAVAATKRANKLDRVRIDLLALPSMSRIKLRVSAGVFEVSLVAVNEERSTVEVIWDDGIKREFKWSSLVWGKMEGQTVGQKPTIAAPPYEQRLHATNVQMQIPRYETQTPDVKAARQPSFSAGPSGAVSQPAQTYAPYVAYSSGQYPYGTGTYSYYSHPSVQPGTGGSTVPYTPMLPQHMTGAMPYSGQPPYPYFGYPATVGPPPGAYVPPGAPPAPAAQRIAPTYSMFSVSGAKPRSSPFSQAFQQTLASSVASLPPRTALPDSGSPAPTPSEQRRRQRPAQADQVPAFTQPLIPPPAMSATPDPTPTQQPPETDTAPVVGGALPPDVMQAVEELQALSALEPAQLQEVLNARPALREAVKLLLAHQPFQSI